MKPLNINRTNDAVFKTIFANQQHKDITLSLINAVFEFQGTEQIDDISFIDREIDPDYISGKESRLDLLGMSLDGTKVNIEIQVAPLAEMGRRSLFYWSRLYNDLNRGDDYTELTRTVAINILEFNLFDKERYPSYHSCFGAYDQNTGNQLTKDLEIHFLELPKWHLKNIKEMNRLEKWLSYFSRQTSPEELEEIAMGEPMIKQALDAEVVFTKDQIQRRAYEKAEKFRRDHTAEIHYALSEGMAKGMAKGKAEGFLQIARNMMLKGFDDTTIQELSGLTAEQLHQLHAELDAKA
jgi:predicted transposase/invertase (TIGR01784 family)